MKKTNTVKIFLVDIRIITEDKKYVIERVFGSLEDRKKYYSMMKEVIDKKNKRIQRVNKKISIKISQSNRKTITI